MQNGARKLGKRAEYAEEQGNKNFNTKQKRYGLKGKRGRTSRGKEKEDYRHAERNKTGRSVAKGKK